MSPGYTTGLANAIVNPDGMYCRFEWQEGCGFVWNFYRGAKFLKRIKDVKKVVTVAEKLVDKGK